MIWILDMLLLALILTLDRKVSGRMYTPLSLFAACWLGTLALRHLNLVDYEPLDMSAAFLIYGSFASFTLGYLLIIVMGRRFWSPLPDAELIARVDPQALTGICALVCGVGILSTVIQISSVVAARGLIGFLINPLEVREEFMLTGWGALFLLNILLPGLLVLRHRARGTGVDQLTVIMGCIAVFGLVMTNQKQAIVKAGVIASVMAALFEQHVRLRSLVVVAAALLLFFVGYARVTSPYYEGDHRFYVRDGHIDLPQELAPLGNPYHYLTSGYGNLQVFTDDLDHHSSGRESLRALRYIWTRLQGSREIEPHHGRFYYAPLFGNTHTYLRQFYADGGIPGAMVLSLLVGVICAWVYFEIIFRGRMWLAPAYGVMGWCLFISFFSNHWIYFGTWLLFGFAGLLGLMSSIPDITRRLVHRDAY